MHNRGMPPIRRKEGNEIAFVSLKTVGISGLRELAAVPQSSQATTDGLYSLRAVVAPGGAGRNEVTVTAAFFVRPAQLEGTRPPYPMGPSGPSAWRPIKSKGVLEKRWSKILRAECLRSKT
jgi:hypothetical protein